MSDGRAVIGMLEASAGRSVAVAKTDETIEPGRLPTGIPVTSPPTEDRTPDGTAVIGMFAASPARSVAVARISETTWLGRFVTGTAVAIALLTAV